MSKYYANYGSIQYSPPVWTSEKNTNYFTTLATATGKNADAIQHYSISSTYKRKLNSAEDHAALALGT